jgi:hypothetical protein
MRHGLRYLLVTLGVSAAMATAAVSAQAYVYWAVGGSDGSGGTTIGRADLNGSGVNHSFAPGASSPAAIAIDASHIYWANDGAESIGRANLNGGDADPTWIPNRGATVSGIAVDGSYIYWTEGDSSDYISRMPIGGGTIDPTFIDAGTQPEGIAVQSGTIYVGVYNQIESVPVAGMQVPLPLGTSLGSGEQVPSLAVGGGYVYFGEFGLDNEIGRMTVDGSDQTSDFISGNFFAGGIATDGTYLYWSSSTDGEIGRALIGSAGATNVEPDFVSEPNDPYGVAVDAGIDPTTTTISCTPATLSTGQASACTATIGDSASTSIPTGTVNFTGNGAAFFSGSPCQLTAKAGGGASCTVGADLTSTGTQSITATYSGDSAHQASSASTPLCAGACGRRPPPPACVVPKLKGKTLSQARAALKKAHCALGKVKTPKHSHGTLKVASSKPRAGTKLRSGSKVTVTLAARRRRR